jgi:hypothetical protein
MAMAIRSVVRCEIERAVLRSLEPATSIEHASESGTDVSAFELF